MGLIGFGKKKEKSNVEVNKISQLITLQALELAIPEIETTKSFLPFGGVFTTNQEFHQVVYHDPSSELIDHRAHASKIQALIQNKYEDPDNIFFFMAWDGIAHLETGDIDCINIRVDIKPEDSHLVFMYTYKLIDEKVVITNEKAPTIRKL